MNIEDYKIINIGDQVTFKIDKETLTGTIVNVYIVPKDYDLVDIDVNGKIYYGIETTNCTLVE